MMLSVKRYIKTTCTVFLQLLLVAGVVASMYSCADNDTGAVATDGTTDLQQILLSVDNSSLTEAVATETRGTTDMNNDEYPLKDRETLGLFVMHEDRYNRETVTDYKKSFSSYNSYYNKEVTFDETDASKLVTPTIYYPVDGKKVQAILYAPKMSDTEINWDDMDVPGWYFTLNTDQFNDEEIKACDLIVGKHYESDKPTCFRSTDPIGITFKHVMSKIKLHFRIKQESSLSDAGSIEVYLNNVRIKGGIRLAHVDDWDDAIDDIDTHDAQISKVTMAKIDAEVDDDDYYTFDAYAIVFPIEDLSAVPDASPVSFTVKFYGSSSTPLKTVEIPSDGNGIPFDDFKTMESGKTYSFTYDESAVIASPSLTSTSADPTSSILAKGATVSTRSTETGSDDLTDSTTKVIKDGKYSLTITEHDGF